MDKPKRKPHSCSLFFLGANPAVRYIFSSFKKKKEEKDAASIWARALVQKDTLVIHL